MNNPSNMLYRGEARDTLHALDLMAAALEHEARTFASYPDDSELTERLRAEAAHIHARYEELRKRIRAAELEFAKALADSADKDDRLISKAIIGQDYTQLAI